MLGIGQFNYVKRIIHSVFLMGKFREERFAIGWHAVEADCHPLANRQSRFPCQKHSESWAFMYFDTEYITYAYSSLVFFACNVSKK